MEADEQRGCDVGDMFLVCFERRKDAAYVLREEEKSRLSRVNVAGS